MVFPAPTEAIQAGIFVGLVNRMFYKIETCIEEDNRELENPDDSDTSTTASCGADISHLL
jgi:hypothetical protein